MEPQLWRDHYNRTAGMYDWKESLWSLLLGYSDHGERQKLVRLLQLKPGQHLLEVSVGGRYRLQWWVRGITAVYPEEQLSAKRLAFVSSETYVADDDSGTRSGYPYHLIYGRLLIAKLADAAEV